MALRGSDCGGHHIGPGPKHLQRKISVIFREMLGWRSGGLAAPLYRGEEFFQLLKGTLSRPHLMEE